MRREGARRGRRLSLAAGPRLRASADAAPGRGDRLLERAAAALAADAPARPLRARSRALAGGGPRAGHVDVLPDRLPLARSRASDPFAGIRTALGAAPPPLERRAELGALLDEVPLGPRSSHDPARGARDAAAYRAVGASARGDGLAGAAFTRRPGAGARSGASSGCSSASRCPGFGRDGALRPARHARAPRALRAARRLAAPRRARGRSRRGPTPRWPPSACSGSAIRCCSSAAPARSPRRRGAASRRSTSRSPTGRRARAGDARLRGPDARETRRARRRRSGV